MKLTSPAFLNNGDIPAKYACDGDNVGPELEIMDVPTAALSLALITIDPDVPQGECVHWVIWNIRPETKEIQQGQMPEGSVQGINDFQKNAYRGPCHATGTHAYLFKLYALDIVLPPNKNLSKKEIRYLMEGHILEKTILKGFYQPRHSESY